jgi:hypothetical protein
MPVSRIGAFVAFAGLLSGAATAACTSMRPVTAIASSPPAPEVVKAGDVVELVMRDGTRARFRVANLDRDVLVADDATRYLRADIVTLTVRRVSTGKTIGLSLAIAGGLALLVIGIAYVLFLSDFG